ncbi:alanine-zipper protein [Henriciella aquimarina]|uniref:alanine-zipper protein n=1 Tax=Henriciella aquimarina TaxID=545261 RepID=UPI0009FFB0F2|nr:alanine-zipper protein [Henriciella aquimarina]
MGLAKFIAGAGLMLAIASCQSVPSDQSIAEYCASPDKASEAICRLKVEIDGNSTALSDTQMSVEEARSLAAAAQTSADEAGAAAAAAQSTADQALETANEALNMGDLDCITETINQSDTGTCPADYTLVACTQTRYTTRAGGLSFLRELNGERCRFNSQVLEMDVRCCRAATGGAQQTVAPENY